MKLPCFITFLSAFLGPFSQDPEFLDYQKSISENLKRVNDWANADWRRLINQALRYQKEITYILRLRYLVYQT